MRWAQRGLSPVRTSLLAIALLAIASYAIFTKRLPFTHRYTIQAVVRDSNLLAPGSPVRIGGVDVGTVLSTSRAGARALGLVRMQIGSGGQPIHADATIAIRPRLFLEGNFYVQLSPGTPGAQPLRDGGTIPLRHTSTPVQLDQVLDALPSGLRTQLGRALQGLGQALDTRPAPAQDRRLALAVRGLTGAEAINQTFDTSAQSLRDSAIVSGALTGPSGRELSQTIDGLGRAGAALARTRGALSALVGDLDRTLASTAAEQQGLRRAVRLLGPTATHAASAFASLEQALAPTERFSTSLAGSLPQLPATISAAYPWLAQARPLLSRRELGGLLGLLTPTAAALARLTHEERAFLPQIDAFDRCMTAVFIPTGNVVLRDGALSSGVPNYQEFFHAMVAQAAEGQSFDGNGALLRIGAAGGPFTVESGQTNYYGNLDTAFAQVAAPPLATRPAYPNRVPPLTRSARCYTQPVPDVNGAASVGPADGSRPDAPAPPVPLDPAENGP